ncbi:MAG TPA: 23S rRNA (uracil(1939)-C(5))-methyltransferase RlmD [bacterium]
MSLKKGDQLKLKIETLAFGGRGVARADGMVIFVDGALPGQQVVARIVRARKAYAEARRTAILEESPEKVTARCPHFGDCGGCLFQNLDYAAQLKYKRLQVIESLQHLGGFEHPSVLEALASPEQFYYRNKMEFSFGDQRWLPRAEIGQPSLSKPKNFALGLHARGRFDKILDLEECYLQSAQSMEIVKFAREEVLQSGIPPYSTRDHSGFWRHLVIREGKNTGDTMVNIVTAAGEEFYDDLEKIGRRLSQKFPAVTTIVHNINRRKAQVAFGDDERVLFGQGVIKERIGHRVFQISANSFFQTNSNGAKVLYDKVIEFADLQAQELVYDLYAGAGTISLYVADRVQQVIAFEMVEAAVRDAERNLLLNGAENCRFVVGDLRNTLAAHSAERRPDTIIIDPPRAGMHAEVVEAVLQLRPQKIVYVSCNPTTFARDAKILCQDHYTVKVVQPVDMFPHTAHIEVVGLLISNEV